MIHGRIGRDYEGLTQTQKQAVFHKEGPLLVLAGPGSGKTRVITFRIAALVDAGVRPDGICAITFTNKAADEMRSRVLDFGIRPVPYVSTFHSMCVRILRQYAQDAGIEPTFTIYDATDQKRCMKEVVKECELDAKSFSPVRMLEAVSSMKNKLISETVFEREATDFFTQKLSMIYTKYQKFLRERNALDFDDLLSKTAWMLERKEQVAKQLANRFEYILVDEYQDTNFAQYQIAHHIAKHHSNICATGDPDQSIYRWRGADIRNILSFEKDWPDAVVIKLEENFRSTPGILEAADKLIANNTHRKAKKLVAVRKGGLGVSIRCYDGQSEEAEGVASQIESLIRDGVSPGEIAVFYRINSMSRLVEEAMIRARIPYQVVRGVEFYNRKEIRDILAYLKVLANPADTLSLMRIINSPKRGIGKTTVEKLVLFASQNNLSLYEAIGKVDRISSINAGTSGRLKKFRELLERLRAAEVGLPVAELFERVYTESGLEASHAAEPEATENVRELIESAAIFDKSAQQGGLINFLQDVALFSDTDTYDEKDERVALMTLHAAKGLEFEHAFILGVEEGLLPHERSSDDGRDIEEERRLLFVGITRAKNGLQLSYAQYRTLHGQILRSVPSPFLYELGLEVESPFGSSFSKGFEPFSLGEKPGKPKKEIKIKNAAPKSKALYNKGELVRHGVFGLGRVKSYNEAGANSVVEVKFNTGQIKQLMVKYANLTKVTC